MHFDDHGPTPLDCAIWALRNNRADDGDCAGVVKALLAAGAPTRFSPPTGDTATGCWERAPPTAGLAERPGVWASAAGARGHSQPRSRATRQASVRLRPPVLPIAADR